MVDDGYVENKDLPIIDIGSNMGNLQFIYVHTMPTIVEFFVSNLMKMNFRHLQ